jgi:hypothetical protein
VTLSELYQDFVSFSPGMAKVSFRKCWHLRVRKVPASVGDESLGTCRKDPTASIGRWAVKPPEDAAKQAEDAACVFGAEGNAAQKQAEVVAIGGLH